MDTKTRFYLIIFLEIDYLLKKKNLQVKNSTFLKAGAAIFYFFCCDCFLQKTNKTDFTGSISLEDVSP